MSRVLSIRISWRSSSRGQGTSKSYVQFLAQPSQELKPRGRNSKHTTRAFVPPGCDRRHPALNRLIVLHYLKFVGYNPHNNLPAGLSGTGGVARIVSRAKEDDLGYA